MAYFKNDTVFRQGIKSFWFESGRNAGECLAASFRGWVEPKQLTYQANSLYSHTLQLLTFRASPRGRSKLLQSSVTRGVPFQTWPRKWTKTSLVRVQWTVNLRARHREYSSSGTFLSKSKAMTTSYSHFTVEKRTAQRNRVTSLPAGKRSNVASQPAPACRSYSRPCRFHGYTPIWLKCKRIHTDGACFSFSLILNSTRAEC